tara:strand:+ start:11701 stop:11862 length:162 start_codon:yes stop_codon:yes gene_type:complete
MSVHISIGDKKIFLPSKHDKNINLIKQALESSPINLCYNLGSAFCAISPNYLL